MLLRSQLAPQEQGRCSWGALAPEEPGSVLLRSPLRVGAPQEPGSVLLRSILGSELLRSQGRCSLGAGARGGSCQERPSPTTRDIRRYPWQLAQFLYPWHRGPRISAHSPGIDPGSLCATLPWPLMPHHLEENKSETCFLSRIQGVICLTELQVSSHGLSPQRQG